MHYRSSSKGRFLAAHPAFAELLGYESPEQLIDQVADIGTQFYAEPEHRSQLLTELCAAGRVESVLARVRRRDGSTIWVAETARAVHQLGDEVVIEGTVADVTVLKHRADELSECKAGYRAMVEHSHDGAFLAVRGRFEFANPAFLRLIGCAPEDLATLRYADVFGDEARDLGAAGVSSRDLAYGEDAELETHAYHRDGRNRIPVTLRLGTVAFRGELARIGTVRDRSQEQRSAQVVAEAEQRYRTIFENSIVGMYQSTPEGRFIDANPALAALLGFDSTAHLMREVEQIRDLYVDPSERDHVLGQLDRSGSVNLLEYRLRRHDGRPIWVLENARAVRGADGEVRWYEGVLQDVTVRRSVQEALLRSEERYRALVEDSQVGVFVNQDGRYSYVNAAFARMLGYDEDELVGRHFADLYAPEALSDALARYEERQRGADSPAFFETKLLHRDGTTRVSVTVAITMIEQDGRAIATGTVCDVTEQKRVERKLWHNATHDPLTGLPNRALFVDRLQRAMQRSGPRRSAYAVLFVDLDGFKVVNDSLGHARGDALLIEIAQRLRRCVRPGDTIARHGGDEFTVLLDHVEGEAEAVRVAQRIQSELERPFRVAGSDLFTSASIGITLGRDDYSVPDEVLRDADTAMYQAKVCGANRHAVFDVRMHDRARQRLEVETHLRSALDRGEFRVHYQPVVDLERAELIGFEALLRWQHPERGLLAPSEFLEVADETGLIVPIGWWVLREATEQLARWHAEHPTTRGLTMSVNLSERQLLHPDLVPQVERAIRRAGLAPKALHVEVTETIFMENAAVARQRLDALKALGIGLHLDDFGTGYSSLSYLSDFPVDTLKVDRSFVSRLLSDPRRLSVVKTIGQLARNLGMRAIVEGIEDAAQARAVRKLGFRYAQGHLFAAALPAAEALSFHARYASGSRGGRFAWLRR